MYLYSIIGEEGLGFRLTQLVLQPTLISRGMTVNGPLKRRSTSASATETRPLVQDHSESGLRRAFEAFEDFAESRVLTVPEDRPDRPPLINPDTPLLRHKLTLTWQEIPAWQQDNEYILTGYRRYVHFHEASRMAPLPPDNYTFPRCLCTTWTGKRRCSDPIPTCTI